MIGPPGPTELLTSRIGHAEGVGAGRERLRKDLATVAQELKRPASSRGIQVCLDGVMPPPYAPQRENGHVIVVVALFPLTVLLSTVNVPVLYMPPPSGTPALSHPPLRMVTPLIFTVTFALMIFNTPALGRALLLPSMIVVDAPPPVMATLRVMSSDVTMVRT